jgi:hypothetical protein
MFPTLDAYSLPARGVPFAAIFVPPLVLFAFGVAKTVALGIASGVVIAVIAAIAGQLGRDRGRQLQAGLWKKWGGGPTLRRLRFRDAKSAGRVERLHGRIESILADHVPSAQEESDDPELADELYEEALARLRALTDDRERFPHLFVENVNYGQRRNMLGLRPCGNLVAGVTLLGAALAIWLADGSLSDRLTRFGPGAAVGLLMLGFWAFVVTPDWVRVTADAYADQFVAAINKLHDERPAGQQTPT